MIRRATCLSLALMSLSTTLGCDPPAPLEPGSEDATQVRPSTELWQQALVPELLESIGQEGLLRTALSPSHQYRPIIGTRDAVSIASHWLSRRAKYVLEYLERGHGAPIDVAALVPDPLPVIAETPHAPLPPSFPGPSHRNWGPYYLVTFRQHGTPAVLIAVSAYATNMVASSTGKMYVGDEGIVGNELRWEGIPLRGLIVPPETAALVASEATGALVTAKPVFVRRSGRHIPMMGAWRVRLDRRVTAIVATAATALHVDELYVDAFSGETFIRLPSQVPGALTQPPGTTEFPLMDSALGHLAPAEFEPEVVR